MMGTSSYESNEQPLQKIGRYRKHKWRLDMANLKSEMYALNISAYALYRVCSLYIIYIRV